MTSIKKNVLYSSILTCSNYIFPLLTFPYVSRVLGVDNIGACNFVTSIVFYFIFFASMGINVLGIREIAKCQKNREYLNKCFSSLFSLNAIATLLSLSIYILSIYLVPQFAAYRELLWIGAFQIILTLFQIEWFFKGIENFKYITTRSLVVKLVYVLLIFLFVKEPNDYIYYFAISTGMVVLNSIFNWNYKTQFVSLSFKSIAFSPYLKPFLILGFYALLTTMYTSFNVVYLGLVTDDKEVGYYTTATKLYGIILSFFTAFTGVIMPRISFLLEKNDKTRIQEIIQQSFEILFIIAFPLILFSVYYAPEIIYFIAGKGYEGAVLPMQISMPLILIMGMEQILIIQLLMPLKADKAIFINSILGALTGICLNILLVGTLKSIGSSVVWFFSEIVVLSSTLYFARSHLKNIFPLKSLLKALFLSLPLIIIYIGIYSYFKDFKSIISLLLGGTFTFIYIVLCQQFVYKNQTLSKILTLHKA